MLTVLSESNQKAFDEAVKSLKNALTTMQNTKDHGKVELTMNMVSGGVSGCFCTHTTTNKVK